MAEFEIKKLDTGEGAVLGIDIGSTTVKTVLVINGEVAASRYERHFSQVRTKALSLVRGLEPLLKDAGNIRLAISGSAGLGLAKAAELPFVQEVFATSETVRELAPDTDVVVELGGEDAKVIFFGAGIDERMNGTCAGGTGAFIDQMATLMDISTQELDVLSRKAERIYPIASRCGVFAKTDIQPLLNQGAKKEDVAASIYQAVVDQTIAGLAQGRRIGGRVMFLGGPLHYCLGLRARFKETLKLTDEEAAFPDYALYAVAIGAVLYASKQRESLTYDRIIALLEGAVNARPATALSRPLFRDKEEYRQFSERHAKASVARVAPEDYSGDAYLGIDCGSTTTKLVLLSDDDRIIYSHYGSNQGNPVEIVRAEMEKIYSICGDRIRLRGSVVTGYGEELIRNAFRVDSGLVETMAHFTAARHFEPAVEFILDIGGQDIKCFKIHNGSIDSIVLNEACSSGCGSFIETFARSLDYDVADFAALGLESKAPVDLGSRCTVFMNSSVKQAQKDGADVCDISAGLSMSVVKNALYKVIRARSAKELGEKIVVQGGTFYNDAVLRSFELEIGREVIRPQIAGLMGAFGAALHARETAPAATTLITAEELKGFVHTSCTVLCRGCGNKCVLTVNDFGSGAKYVSGNQCEKGSSLITGEDMGNLLEIPDLYRYKREKLLALNRPKGERGVIGIPMALGMYELAPFWQAVFTDLGYGVVLSGYSSRRVYAKGQYSIPSDTACYPAKLMHGHIETLIERGVDAIFYPCLTYNVNEKKGQNHYNCPVVAYYSELLQANMEDLKKVRFLYPYVDVNDPAMVAKQLSICLDIPLKETRRAVRVGRKAYRKHMADVRAEGERAIRFARENGRRIMILAGRPYHVDPEICHGIDALATSLGFVVVSEDCVAPLVRPIRTNVLNQWTYHARLYNAARYAVEHRDCELVQLVSFGCGLDAITTDEVRSILEKGGKLYTQIKIDEITNLGAVRIRLRSLLGALEERGEIVGK